MKHTLTLLFAASLLLAACAPAPADNGAAAQTAALATLQAEASAVQAELQQQAAQTESAAAAAATNAQQTEQAAPPTATNTLPEPPTAAPTTPSLPSNTPHPTRPPGIAARFVHHLTCNGVRYAIVRVISTSPQTLQSAIVVLEDVAGNEIRRSDGNNEFLPNANACPGTEQPTLAGHGEGFVSVSAQGLTNGDTYTIWVTACTEKGYKGDCWRSSIQFVH